MNTESTVILDYWEEPDEFFVFERAANYIHIKYFNRIYPIADGRIQGTSIYGINMIAETVETLNNPKASSIPRMLIQC